MNRFLAALYLFFCSASAQRASATPVSRTAEEDDIREVVLRPQLARRPEPAIKKPIVIRGQKGVVNARPGKPVVIHVPAEVKDVPQFYVYFLSVNGKDPSAQLIKRFEGQYPPVKKISQSYLITDFKEDDSGLWVRDKQTKEIGIRFDVSQLRWKGRNKVTLASGYMAGGLYAGGGTYTLVKRRKAWRIAHVEYGPPA